MSPPFKDSVRNWRTLLMDLVIMSWSDYVTIIFFDEKVVVVSHASYWWYVLCMIHA